MSNPQLIPQFKLQNDTGEFVDFHLMLWGNKEQNYDFEKPHRHNFNEIMLFYKGGGIHDIDFTTYKAQSRSLHFVASDNVHLVLRAKNSSGCSLLFSNDFFRKELIAQLPFSKTNPVLNLTKDEFNTVTNLVETIKAEYTDKQAGYQEIIQTYMQALMLQLIRFYKKHHPDEIEKSARPELIIRFLEIIGQFYKNHFTVEQYAEKLNISPKHLIELCKTHTGKTPLQHIREYTISEIKKLLYFTKLSVKEIAYQLGFDDPSNFSKYFKSATNYTPVEYRAGIR